MRNETEKLAFSESGDGRLSVFLCLSVSVSVSVAQRTRATKKV